MQECSQVRLQQYILFRESKTSKTQGLESFPYGHSGFSFLATKGKENQHKSQWCWKANGGKIVPGIISGYSSAQAPHCIHLTQREEPLLSLQQVGLTYSPNVSSLLSDMDSF